MSWEIVVHYGATVDYNEGSASVLDNRFFGNLLDERGLLRTDVVLVQNATTRAKVAAFAQSQKSFFASWANSFVRLTGASRPAPTASGVGVVETFASGASVVGFCRCITSSHARHCPAARAYPSASLSKGHATR